MKQKFLSFLMTVIALVGMAMPAWATDWGNAGTTDLTDGMYYLYNPRNANNRPRFLQAATNASLTADSAMATPFFVKRQGSDTVYTISYCYEYYTNSTSNACETRYLNPTNNASNSWTTAVINDTVTSNGDGTYKIRYIWSSTNYVRYLRSTGNGLLYNDVAPVSGNADWALIPASTYMTAMTKTWKDDNVVKVSTTVDEEGGLYYLYNPAKKRFLKKNKGSDTNRANATVFYIKKNSNDAYTITYADGTTIKYVNPSWTWTDASCDVQLESTTIDGYTYYSIRTEADAQPYYYLAFNSKSTSLTRVKKESTFDYDGSLNIHGQWVLIPKSVYDAAPVLPEQDDWVDNAVAPGDGGLFCIYNPATQKFLGTFKTLVSNVEAAGLYYVDKQMVVEDTYYTITGTSMNTTSIANLYQPLLNYIKIQTSWGTIPSLLSAANTTGNRYTISEYVSPGTYFINTVANNNTPQTSISYPSYPYTPDAWAEWVFVPYSYYKSRVTSPHESDPVLAYAQVPVNGGKYLLYNVENRYFVKWMTLTSESTEAAECAIKGDTAIALLNNNADTVYFCANTNGWFSSSDLKLTWDRVSENSATPTYYIYNKKGSYDIYAQSGYNSPTSYVTSAIKTNSRPDNLGGNFEWAFITPPRTLYYSANAVRYEGNGTVRVSFLSGSVGEASDNTGTQNTLTFEESLPTNVYFKAEAAEGYQFMGWKLDPLGDFISTEEEFTYTDFVASSTDSDHPDNVTLYAYFEKYDAEVFDTDGIKQGDYETLAGAITAASKGYTIKLKRNITGPLTINKGVTIDFNGYTISGTENDVVTVSAPSTDTVTFADGAIQQAGGVELRVCTSSVTNAINVTAGILVINSGHYTAFQCWNQSGVQAYVINRTGGNVRVNGGYFRSYTQDMTTALWTQRYQKYIFNGSNIKLYGGYFAGNCDELQEVWKYNDTYTLPIVSNNVGLYVGADMELVNNPVADPHTDVYIYKVQSAFDEASVVATADGKKFSSLADAIAYANNNAETTMTIRLAKNCELEAGTYTIPEKATLIVPYSSLHTEPLIACPLLNNSKLPKQAYRTLTLASGVHIDVYGAIELGGCAYSYGNGATGTGRPNSDYGQMIMNEGSQIVLNNGANLRAWGFVTGAGTIDARRGARVDEMFQVYDFKGGRGTLAMYENGGHKAFPMNQYFIQNVEVKTTYRPGSALYTTMAAVNVSVSVKVIGVDTDGAALFKMKATDASEDTWVRKWYNPATDQQVYDINNSADISNLKLPLSSVIGVQDADFDSKDYILPITNNFKIHVLAGEINITQDVAFLPGAELEIDKQCYGNIKQNTTTYFYDSEEWGTYVYNGAYASKIKYRPGGVPNVRNISSAAGLGDAKMNIHGTLKVDGGFRTTEGGANIFSTNADAGTVSYTENSLTTYTDEILDTWTHQVYHAASADNDYKASADAWYIGLPAYPAKLQNASGFTPTQTESDGANAGKSFCYINGAWSKLTDEGCFVTDGTNYYAKPKDYVKLLSDAEDGNHLFYSADESRTFILLSEGCELWEVEDVAGHPELKHSIHPDNDVYYYYDEEDGWKEKRFTIKWLNWDGTALDTCEMKMGAKLQYLGSTPAREKSAYYTYDFAGWSPAIASDAVVSGDATYTAQFNQTDRKYLITFTGNQLVSVSESQKSQYLRMGEMPDVPDRGAYAAMFVWSPAVRPVTGDADYTLDINMHMYDPTLPYTITFVNWNGDELQSGSVNVGETPVYDGATPVKPAIGDESYTFIGWTPEIVAATADAVYMAKFAPQHISGLNITTDQTISDTRQVTDLYVTQTGVLTITGSVQAKNFILESNGSTASGQFLAGYDKLTYTHAYFDLKLNAKNHQWYGVAVPWPVNATSGISVNGRTLELGKDFDIIYYNGAQRAEKGKQKCWSYVQNDGDKTLVPGRLYMIGLMGDAAVVRFEKKADGEFSTTTTSVTAYSHPQGVTTDRGWNGVANPALFHAFVNPGVTEGQVFVPSESRYEPISLNTAKFVVGQGAFVQVPATIEEINAVTSSPFSAPRRAKAQTTSTFDVRIAPAEAEYTDRLFIKTTDSRENRYTIGQDLAKVGVSSKVAQMWINRYDSKLCVNTAELINETADYPLGISVPANGEYTISNIQSPMSNDDYTLYLTLNGEVIWNLSESAFVLSLEKGTTNAYGLRLNTNKMPTAIDEAVVDAQGQTRKVLINNQIFILRGDKVYSIDGQMVK